MLILTRSHAGGLPPCSLKAHSQISRQKERRQNFKSKPARVAILLGSVSTTDGGHHCSNHMYVSMYLYMYESHTISLSLSPSFPPSLSPSPSYPLSLALAGLLSGSLALWLSGCLSRSLSLSRYFSLSLSRSPALSLSLACSLSLSLSLSLYGKYIKETWLKPRRKHTVENKIRVERIALQMVQIDTIPHPTSSNIIHPFQAYCEGLPPLHTN